MISCLLLSCIRFIEVPKKKLKQSRVKEACVIGCSTSYSPTYHHNAAKATVIVMVHSVSISYSHLQTRCYQMIIYSSIDIFAFFLYCFAFVSNRILCHASLRLPLLMTPCIECLSFKKKFFSPNSEIQLYPVGYHCYHCYRCYFIYCMHGLLLSLLLLLVMLLTLQLLNVFSSYIVSYMD
jgi:hypothetical protein